MKDATAGEGLSLGRAILYGTLAVGVLDLLTRSSSSGCGGRTDPDSAEHRVGSAGRAAYDGGLGTAAFGVLLHFFIAFGIVTTYVLASRR